jgi:class 3 adenylate cyclase
MVPASSRTTTAATATSVSGAIVFTDISGFTEFTALEGDDQALEVLNTQARVVTASLPSGARVVKELGDGLLLWFPDGPSAVMTSLDLQERFENEMQLPL